MVTFKTFFIVNNIEGYLFSYSYAPSAILDTGDAAIAETKLLFLQVNMLNFEIQPKNAMKMYRRHNSYSEFVHSPTMFSSTALHTLFYAQ